MKKQLLALSLILLLLLSGCNAKGGNEDYTQKSLPVPSRIEVQTGSATVEYLPETEEFQKIYSAILPNWWKTAADKPDTAPDDALFMAEAPGQLQTSSDRTYRESDDTFLCFYYEDSPLPWVNPNSTADIQLVAFLLPQQTESVENVKGFYLISKTGNIGTNEGLFTYYYPPEIAAGFWDFLLHE